MQISSELEFPALSGLNHIDALIGIGPNWNLLAGAGNIIKYTFSITSGTEPGETGLVAFNSQQQETVRSLLSGYIANLTGIQFVETADGESAQIHFCYRDLEDAVGLCVSYLSYITDPETGAVSDYGAQSYIYFDNVEALSENTNLHYGRGYETLLHEVGHMLGLKHPFEAQAGNPAVFPAHLDNSANSLMAYNEVGGPHFRYRPADVAALNWLYGRDGLGGALGLNSSTGGRYVTGSDQPDMLRASLAADMIDGAEGADTMVFTKAWADYLFNELPNGDLGVAGPDGADVLRSVELFQFSDGLFERAHIRDLTPPAMPSINNFVNENGYTSRLWLSGTSDVGSRVRVVIDGIETEQVIPAATGLWYFSQDLAQGVHTIRVDAVDGVGNASNAVLERAFTVDSLAPLAPTVNLSFTPGQNRPLASGTGEPGTTIHLGNLGKALVGADGHWTLRLDPLLSQSYNESVYARDAANNQSFADSRLKFTISSTLDRIGTWENDVLRGDAGDNAVNGYSGMDTMHYDGRRADYTVTIMPRRATVDSAADGYDNLIDVERLAFSDMSLALDTEAGAAAGRAYRLYRAAFDRVPDKEGLGFWIAMFGLRLPHLEIERGFIDSAEFSALYGQQSSDVHFVSKLYEHVLHRAPDGPGFDYWVTALEKGVKREDVLYQFSESKENIAQVIGAIQFGIEYLPFG